MDINKIVGELNKLFEEGRGIEGELILQDGIKEAVEEEDNGALLSLLNELIGYYRQYARTEESYEVAERIKVLLDYMELEGSIPYATSYLNIATAYRSGGRFEESMEAFNIAGQIYDREISRTSMFRAGFLNNKALLCQEMGKLNEALPLLKEALEIAKQNNASYEIAATHTNIANTYLGMSEFDLALDSAKKAIDIYDKSDKIQPHFASALYACGVCHKHYGKIEEALENLNKAAEILEKSVGKNEFYYRVMDEIKRTGNLASNTGMLLARELYDQCLKPVIEREIPTYRKKIAVGLIGKGSDCFGFDDELSRDHDWGPDLCLFVTKETYEQIGEKLEKIYESLPSEFKGYKKARTVSRTKRRGVFVIDDFFKGILGVWPVTPDKFPMLADYNLAECVNGEIFYDPEGIITGIRAAMAKGYPLPFLFRKVAQSASTFSQCGQYNYPRMLQRNDELTAQIMKSEALKQAMKLGHYLENKYPPHDKWLYTSCKRLGMSEGLCKLLDAQDIDGLGKFFVMIMYEMGFISDSDDYLDHHAEELIFKSNAAMLSRENLVKNIVELEFKAFDKVQNEGGRASCQNNFPVFNIMRSSQYNTWNREMLLQYYYDFDREMSYGHNLITEKYGRMMESTAPVEYEKIKDQFPPLTEEKKNIINQIVEVQVKWMDDFAARFPKLAEDARSIRAAEDNLYNTSYETYLRGELGTYSDRMLELYGRYVVEKVKAGKNLADEIMLNTAKMYGYDSLEAAEAAK